MTILWEVWDAFEKFNLIEAACLWLEIEPTEEIMNDPPYQIKKVSDSIYRKFPYFLDSILKIKNPNLKFREVSRQQLIEMANEQRKKPKFLFPEARVNSLDKANQLEDRSMSTKERNSYLKLIKGLLKKLDKDPGERGMAQTLEGYVRNANQSLTDDTILKILKEVQELDED